MSLNRALELPLSESLTGHFNEQQSKMQSCYSDWLNTFLLTACIQSLLSSQLLIWCIHGYTWMRALSRHGKNIFEFLVFICAIVVFSCKDLFFTLGLHVRAKSLHSCLTLCNPMDCSLPVSTVHGILQARILEWVALFQGIFPTPVWLLLISVRKLESDLWKPYIYRSKEMAEGWQRNL